MSALPQKFMTDSAQHPETGILKRSEFNVAGQSLLVVRRLGNRALRIWFHIQKPGTYLLHWGLQVQTFEPWTCPPRNSWPAGTAIFDAQAVRTPFQVDENGMGEIEIRLEKPIQWRGLAFVIFDSHAGKWLKNGADDFLLPIPRDRGDVPDPAAALRNWFPEDAFCRKEYSLETGDELALVIYKEEDEARIHMATDAAGPLLLHWGLAERFRNEWNPAPEHLWPEGTLAYDEKAVRTLLQEREKLRTLDLVIPRPAEGTAWRGVNFVFYQPENDRWIKHEGNNIYRSLFKRKDLDTEVLGDAALKDAADEIVAAEVGKRSWTLMHRYNLCHDLMQSVEDNPEALALLFVWLRYSAIRQLDWQRHYNTKPSLLAHAQGRLNLQLAGIWRRHPACRRWVRLMLGVCGRGGEGQQVRDEILHVMHRNDLKECRGTFMEEWHQKLHNNTTPDDVVICEAYLAFLRSEGDLNTFYRTCEAGGVTRERMQSYERSIHTAPVFFGDKKDNLIRDFEHYLRILKAVHSGADLGVAIDAVRGRVSSALRAELERLPRKRQADASAVDMPERITSIRGKLALELAHTEDEPLLLEMLFLDLALEEQFRVAIEQKDLSNLDRDRLIDLVAPTVENLALTHPEEAWNVAGRHWNKLEACDRSDSGWALQAMSAIERFGVVIQAHADDLYQILQPEAEFFGHALMVENWTVPIFSEEIVRGGLAFVLSQVLKPLDPILREAAGLGGWQIISPVQAFGRVRIVDSLIDVQEELFEEATVLVTEKVDGDEEIPTGVTGVITTDKPDLVSHVAVRARNIGVLMATCYESDLFDEVGELAGRTARFAVTPSGDVEYEEAEITAESGADLSASEKTFHLKRRECDRLAVVAADFNDEIVGGKSNNLNRLRGNLPDWIRLPASMALPFGVCETVIRDPLNTEQREKMTELVENTEKAPGEYLPQVRDLVRQLIAPDTLKNEILKVWDVSGLPSLEWEKIWHGVRRVWASKWNERAFLSRRALGIPHADLQMACLIQQVVESDYAYVLHTANPITGDRGEIFGELVLGMGETLVGNYPGRALGFLCRKDDRSIRVLGYPGKSVGLYGKGVIFRSDSNGEDLDGFAGAGLYDSFLADEEDTRILDYADEPLFWDEDFRTAMVRRIAEIGRAVEDACGFPQDIEGARSGEEYYVVQTRPQVGLEENASSREQTVAATG